MFTQKLMEEFMAKVSEIVAASPAKDLEKNLRASLTALFSRMDLVTREEFDVQAQVLARTREQLRELEARLSKLDGGAPATPPASDTEAEDAIQPS